MADTQDLEMSDAQAEQTRNLKRHRDEVESGKSQDGQVTGGSPAGGPKADLEGGDGSGLVKQLEGLLSPETAALNEKRQQLRAELAALEETEKGRKLRGLDMESAAVPAVVPALTTLVSGAKPKPSKGCRAFGTHVSVIPSGCPAAFSVAALQATNKTLKSLVHSARGGPRKLTSVVPDLLTTVRNLAPAATAHSFAKTLGLRTAHASSLRCKKIYSLSVQGGLEKQEVEPFVNAGLPNSLMVAEFVPAGQSGSQTYPEFSIFLAAEESTAVLVSTSPMAGANGLESVFGLVEGPDLVGLSESEGSLVAKLQANLEQAEKEGLRGKGAGGSGAIIAAAKSSHSRLEGMCAVWVRHADGVTDAEEAISEMRADSRLAHLPSPYFGRSLGIQAYGGTPCVYASLWWRGGG